MNFLPHWLRGQKPVSPEHRRADAKPDFTPLELDTPLLYLSPEDEFTVRQAVENLHIWGAIGSAKSSGSGATFARAYLQRMGGLVNCMKPEEAEVWVRYLTQTLRSASLLRVSPSGPWRCNLLQYIYAVLGKDGSRTDRIVDALMVMNDMSERGESSGGGKDERFFRTALKKLIRALTDICGWGASTISAELLYQAAMSLPRTHEEVHEQGWQERSKFYQLLEDADRKQKSDREQRDFDQSARFLLQEFLDYPPETRGSVIATFGVAIDPLLRGVMAELFGGKTNFVPDLSWNGAVIVLDLSPMEHGSAGTMVQAGFTHVWQMAAQQRAINAASSPAFWWCDEAHLLVNETTSKFLSTSRSARIASVLISQNRSNYLAALGGEKARDSVDSMLSCINTHIFHANASAEHNRWASSLFAKHWQTRTNYSTNRGPERDSTSGGGSDMLESKILEAEFTTLKKGGPANDFCTEAIVFQGGRVFNATGDTFLKTIFRQKVR